MQEAIIQSLALWGDKLKERGDALELAVLKSKRDNKWFEIDQQWKAIDAIADYYLNGDKLRKWLNKYPTKDIKPRNIGLICAGNVPAVGFHDILSVLISGHRAMVKVSSKDEHLLPAMLSILEEIDSELASRVEFVGKLKGYDAVIATGSDNSSRYFFEYFSHVPHLIRKNRQGIAVIDENISDDEIIKLKEDVFSYFGLGCRNVAMIMLPQMFQKERLYANIIPEKSMRDNDKYENNYNYNLAICMLEHIDFKTNDELLFIESDEIHSRIASIHLKEYKDISEVEEFIQGHNEQIQCVVANNTVQLNQSVLAPGDTQKPNPWDYADGVDTLEFLFGLG